MRYRVILPILNQPGYSELCIKFLYQTKYDFKATIIDNGSLLETKNLLKQLQKQYGFDLIRYELPTNWQTCIKKGITSTIEKPDFFVLLQNDCFIGQTFFEKITQTINEMDPQAKVFLPTTNYSRYNALKVKGDIPSRFLKEKHANKGLPLNTQQIEEVLKSLYEDFQTFVSQRCFFKKSTYCSAIDSYCLIVNSQVFEEQFFFDSDFLTLGWVEKEWMERLQQAGDEAWILNEVFVHHHGNLTTDGNGFNYPLLFACDRERYQEKIRGS